jgi:hypothetical protein
MQGVDERSVGDRRPRARARRRWMRHGLAGLVLATVGLFAAGAATGGSSPISVSVSGASGANGWYVSDAAIDWTVSLPWVATSGCVDETVGETSSYTASCTAEDGLGGSTSDSVTVKVDKSPPDIGSHGDVTESTTDPGGKNVSFSPPSASDNVSGPPSVSCSPASGSHFNVGNTTVSCRATNDAGLESSPSTFTVTVNFVDNTPPVITHSISGTAGDAGWYTSDVTVTWTVTDPQSTPTSCAPDTLTEPGGTATCTATSQGGSTTSSVTVKIDKTKPTLNVPSVVNDSTTDPAGKSVTFTVTSDGTVTCSPASGSHFPIGTTPVSCTARDPAGNTAGPAGFNVNLTKIDTTPPVVTPTVSGTLGNAGWYRSNVTISFAVSDPDGPVTPGPGCAGASLTADTPGTTVTCTATSQGGTTTSSVTVKIDKTPPTLVVPATVSATTPVPSGAVVTYTVTSSGGTPSCSPGSGSTFPVGTTQVSCTATDPAGNTAGPTPFNVVVTLVDTTAPVVSPHADETREATASTGAAVTYALPGATDNLDTTPTVTCAPASGSSFPIGSTVVTCTAKDDFNNTGTGTFNVIVADTTPPVVSVPASKTVEANGPGGSTSSYEVSASDLGEPVAPGRISCSPASGSNFPLGSSTVTCTATDAVGNKGAKSFTITVSDNTPPVLHAPSEASFFADAPSGIPSDHSAVQRFLRSPVAQDIVDESVQVFHNAPNVFPMGDTTVTFRAVDDAGNTATQTARVNVKPRPADQPTGQPALPTVDIIPPQNPRGVGANSTPGSITISWQPVSDAEQYEVYRSAADRSLQGSTATPSGTLVYRGKATRFKDSKVTGGVEYRYVIVAVDKAGNRSVGEVVVAVGKRLLLLQPARGAKSSKPPVLVLAPVAGATYYNIQLFRGTQKILSIWPVSPRFALPLTWRYGGRPFRLSPGVYRWYAWPGLGKREEAHYGAVMGESTFTIVPAKKATKKKATTKKATKGKKASSSKSKTSKKRKR